MLAGICMSDVVVYNDGELELKSQLMKKIFGLIKFK